MSTTAELPGSVLFCCDHNAVRSPMAEGMMKSFYGQATYVQSAGVRGMMEVDGFSVAVCEEIGVSLARHRTRSIDEMREWGDDLSGYDLIIAMSPASLRVAQEATRYASLEIEYWPIMDPTDLGTRREEKLDAYRQTREQIKARILARFGPALDETSR